MKRSALILSLLATPALGQDTVILTGGGTLLGKVVEQTDQQVVLEELTLGRLELPKDQVTSVQMEGQQPMPPAVQPEIPEWKYRLELGLNGAAGNTESLNLFSGGGAKYESDRHRTELSLRYNYGLEDSSVSRNDARFNGNWDRLFPGEPLFAFAQGLAEFDDFQAWTVRVGAFVGPGYNFIDNDRFTLIGRLGAGVVREWNENDTRPEALVQVDVTWNLTDNQSITATNRFFPSLESFFTYRNVTEAAWQMKLDKDDGLAFRLSVINEYESETSDDSEHNDIKYMASVIYAF